MGDPVSFGRAGSLRRGVLGLGLALVVGCGGCAPTTVSLAGGARAYTPRDYQDVYERWTRSEDRFAWSQMKDLLHVTATFESWDFRWAYVTRYADDEDLGPERRDTILRASLIDARRYHRFFVTLSGESYRESDLTGKRSA